MPSRLLTAAKLETVLVESYRQRSRSSAVLSPSRGKSEWNKWIERLHGKWKIHSAINLSSRQQFRPGNLTIREVHKKIASPYFSFVCHENKLPHFLPDYLSIPSLLPQWHFFWIFPQISSQCSVKIWHTHDRILTFVYWEINKNKKTTNERKTTFHTFTLRNPKIYIILQ